METEFYKIFSLLLKELNITQKDFANMIGVGQGTVSKWLSGIQEPNFKSLQKICKVFGIDGNDILGL